MLDDEGTLTISGTGYYITSSGWEATAVKKVVIQDGLKSIGNSIFSGCSSLTSVTIPDSMKSIGNEAFRYCKSLNSITIPDGVKSIGNYAFSGCSSLASVTIPDSVTSIGEAAFYYCKNLTSIIVSPANWEYSSVDGVLFNNSQTKLLQYPSRHTETSYVIPDSVTSIGYGAFSGCSNLTSITVPEGVTVIGQCAFLGCSNLISITIPDGVTSIDYGTFASCSMLTSITIPNSVTSINEYAFQCCSSLNSITIPNSVTSIDEYAFDRCSSLTSIIIPDGVTSIGNYAFYSCSSLTSVTLPESITNLGVYVFEGCNNLTSFTALFDIGLFNSILSLGRFSSFDNLKKVSIPLPHTRNSRNDRFIDHFPSTVEEIVLLDGGNGLIWEYYFSGCEDLVSITLPSCLKAVQDNAFSGCSNLTNVYASSIEAWLNISFANYASTPMYCAENLYIDGQLLTSVVIPESATNIDNHFYGCNSLTSITIPSSVTNIVSYAFDGCNIQEVHIASLNDWMQIDFNNSYSANPLHNGGKLYISDVPLLDVNIPEGITNISNYAFYGSSLTNVTIPDSVTTIGEYAFSNCNHLKSISIPDNCTKIGAYAFSSCDNLNQISFPDSKTYIGKNAFEFCASLFSITLTNCSADDYAFRDCPNLSCITIPNSEMSFGQSVFWGCYALENIIIPGTTRPTYTLDSPDDFTVYCYEYTDVDFWAVENGYNVSYLDNQFGPIAFKLAAPLPTMEKDTTQMLLVNIFPEMEDSAITWSSSASSVASVADGVVTAVNPGTATITATCGGATASVKIEVHANAECFTLSPAELWVVSKETTNVQINVLPVGADVEFKATSHDSTTITPSISGNTISILALRPGDTSLIVTDTISGLTQTCTVHVFYPVTAVAFEQSKVSVPLNGTTQLIATVTARDQSVTNQLVTFSSSNKAVVTVDQLGVVTGLAKGTATITATASSGVSASCIVSVRDVLTFTLPASLIILEEEALMGTNAEMYILPQGMQTIGARAFASCSNLVGVTIPSSVTSIADNAFEGCGDFTITAPEDSYAHIYALQNGIHWVAQ